MDRIETREDGGVTPYGEGGIFKRGSRWWIRYPGLVNGRPQEIRESAGPRATEKEARTKLRRRLMEVESAKDGLRGFVGPIARRLTVAEVVKDYIDILNARRIRSILSVCAHSRPLLKVLGTHRVLALRESDVMTYVEARRGQGKADSTIDHELEVLRGALNKARKAGRIFSVPEIPMLVKRNANARQGFLEPEEFFRLLSHIETPDFADFLEFFWWTAMRPGEIASLVWSEYDEKARTLRLRAQDAKIGKARTIPVVGPLVALLDRRKQNAVLPYIFHVRGQKATRPNGGMAKGIYAEWRRALAAAELPATIIPYDLRRSALRNTLKAGASEKTAMELGGWLTRSTMERYHIVTESDLADAIRAAGERATQHKTDTKNEKEA